MVASAGDDAVGNAGQDKPAFSKDYFDHIKRVNDVFYDQIKISDQKAAYIFTFMVAFLVTSAEARRAFSFYKANGVETVVALLSVVLILSIAVALLASIVVVLPRHRAAGTSLFWGAWPSNRDPFRSAAETDDGSYLFTQYLANADALSAIARRKYAYVTLAFRALIVTAVSYLLLLVLG